MHFFFVLKLFDVWSPQTRKDVPVHVTQIIAGDVITKVSEVRTAAALSRQVFAARAIRQATIWLQSHALNLVER